MLFYHEGAIVELLVENYMTIQGSDRSLVRQVKVFARQTSFYEYLTYRDKLEPIVTELYKEGDVIKLVNGDYIGVVSGFEPHTNSVVTRPYGEVVPQLQHVRYVHNVKLIKSHNPNHIELKPGKYYRVNDSKNVMAIGSTTEVIHLVDKYGSMVYNFLPPKAYVIELHSRGIRSIKQITQKEWSK